MISREIRLNQGLKVRVGFDRRTMGGLWGGINPRTERSSLGVFKAAITDGSKIPSVKDLLTRFLDGSLRFEHIPLQEVREAISPLLRVPNDADLKSLVRRAMGELNRLETAAAPAAAPAEPSAAADPTRVGMTRVERPALAAEATPAPSEALAAVRDLLADPALHAAPTAERDVVPAAAPSQELHGAPTAELPVVDAASVDEGAVITPRASVAEAEGPQTLEQAQQALAIAKRMHASLQLDLRLANEALVRLRSELANAPTQTEFTRLQEELRAKEGEVDRLQVELEIAPKPETLSRLESDLAAAQARVRELEARPTVEDSPLLSAARERVEELTTQIRGMVAKAELEAKEAELGRVQARLDAALISLEGKADKADLDAANEEIRRLAEEEIPRITQELRAAADEALEAKQTELTAALGRATSAEARLNILGAGAEERVDRATYEIAQAEIRRLNEVEIPRIKQEVAEAQTAAHDAKEVAILAQGRSEAIAAELERKQDELAAVRAELAAEKAKPTTNIDAELAGLAQTIQGLTAEIGELNDLLTAKKAERDNETDGVGHKLSVEKSGLEHAQRMLALHRENTGKRDGEYEAARTVLTGRISELEAGIAAQDAIPAADKIDYTEAEREELGRLRVTIPNFEQLGKPAVLVESLKKRVAEITRVATERTKATQSEVLSVKLAEAQAALATLDQEYASAVAANDHEYAGIIMLDQTTIPAVSGRIAELDERFRALSLTISSTLETIGGKEREKTAAVARVHEIRVDLLRLVDLASQVAPAPVASGDQPA